MITLRTHATRGSVSAAADPNQSWARTTGLCVVLALCFGLPAGAIDSRLFPLPEVLEPNVEFWIQVFTGYDSHHVIVHDERHLQVIYTVLDFTELDTSQISPGRRQLMRSKEITQARARIRTLLQNLAAGKTSGSHPEEQARIERLFQGIPGGRSKYSAATTRLRTQTCLRDQFAEGLERSGVYMAAIEDIFQRRNLPVELTRMPFFESLFQWKARSSAQAGGIWQFVPSSARLYRLKMDSEVDERYDPLRATEAAASHLEDNYKSLRTWPLAITGYNHGPAGYAACRKAFGDPRHGRDRDALQLT